jgi:membrane protein DedA with SNARE-associated domain
VLRGTIAWIAGLAGMSWPRFLLWNAAGGIVWAIDVALLTYFGGKALADTVSRHGLYAVATIAVVAVIAIGPKLIARLQSRPRDSFAGHALETPRGAPFSSRTS